MLQLTNQNDNDNVNIIWTTKAFIAIAIHMVLLLDVTNCYAVYIGLLFK